MNSYKEHYIYLGDLAGHLTPVGTHEKRIFIKLFYITKKKTWSMSKFIISRTEVQNSSVTNKSIVTHSSSVSVKSTRFAIVAGGGLRG